MNSAIVLGTNVNGIGVIRSLGRMGVDCAAIYEPVEGDHALRSKYLSSSIAVDKMATHVEINDAVDLLAKRLDAEFPVIIPTTDKFSQFLSDNQQRLSKNYLFRCSSKELNESFLDKWKTDRICRDHDVRVPTTYCPRSNDELAAVSESIRYPVIVKPRYTFDDNFPGKNAIFQTRQVLRNFFASTGLLGKAVIQEIVPSGDGDILVVASYSDRDGLVKAMYSGRKIRQFLPDYGATCFGISEKNAELESRSRNFLNDIGYKGFAALEYARSRSDGHLYFFELNTRTYYHNQLFADAGVDLTQIGYDEITGVNKIATKLPSEQRDGLMWIDFRRDFYSMRIKRKQGKITIAKWLLSLLKPRSFAYWSLRDPLPFLAACSWRTKQLLSKRARLAINTVLDIDRNRQTGDHPASGPRDESPR